MQPFVAVKPVLRSGPYESVVVLQQELNVQVLEAIFFGINLESVVLRLHLDYVESKQYQPCKNPAADFGQISHLCKAHRHRAAKR